MLEEMILEETRRRAHLVPGIVVGPPISGGLSVLESATVQQNRDPVLTLKITDSDREVDVLG